MYLLQGEQKAAVSTTSKSRNQQVGAKPFRERIEELLAKSDHEVLLLPAEEIRALIVSGIELFKDQEHFLSGRKAQLMFVFCFWGFLFNII